VLSLKWRQVRWWAGYYLPFQYNRPVLDCRNLDRRIKLKESRDAVETRRGGRSAFIQGLWALEYLGWGKGRSLPDRQTYLPYLADMEGAALAVGCDGSL
jgi:hypothetical protein